MEAGPSIAWGSVQAEGPDRPLCSRNSDSRLAGGGEAAAVEFDGTKRLALRELEAGAGTLLAVLLALLDPGVPGQEAGRLEAAPKFRVVLK